MDEIEPGAKQDTETRRRSHHRHRENLEGGLLLGEVDEVLTDLIFGAAPVKNGAAGLPSDHRGFVDR